MILKGWFGVYVLLERGVVEGVVLYRCHLYGWSFLLVTSCGLCKFNLEV